jgi:probable phosphoglycerate mutase
MSILLVRHGETLLNAARTLQPAATPLGPRGEAQARALARRLSQERIGAIVSSDLPRAWQTASAIADATGVAVIAEPLLQERNFGDLRGQPYDGLGFDPLHMTEAPPGGESEAAFRARVALAFERIARLAAALDGDLVVVSHGLVIGALLERHARLDDGVALPERLGNTGLTILSVEPPHRVGLLDCTAHLAGEIEEDASSLAGG